MRYKLRSSALVFCALGVIATGLTGCSSQQPDGKSKEEVTAFAGDLSKMPASYRERISGSQNAATAQKQAAVMQEKAATKGSNAAK